MSARAKVAVLRTRPDTVLDDYARLMRLADYASHLPKDRDTALKINITWHHFFPAVNTTPWQLDGVIRTMLQDGYARERLHACHNRTVVVSARKGEVENGHKQVVDRHALRNVHLYENEPWTTYEPKSKMLVLDKIYPKGIEIPKRMIGENIIHLPLAKCVGGQTRVVLADGRAAAIGDLVEEALARGTPLVDADGDVHVDASLGVATLGGRAAAVRLHRTPTDGLTVLRVATRTGRSVVVSAQHPFLTPRGWKPAAEIAPGERIAIPRRIAVEGSPQPLPTNRFDREHLAFDVRSVVFRDGIRLTADVQRQVVERYVAGETLERIAHDLGRPWQTFQSVLDRYGVPKRAHTSRHIQIPERTSPDFWRWMGYFAAEGWVQRTRGSARVWWVNNDPELVDDFVELTQRLFGLRMTKRGGTSIDWYVDSLGLATLLADLGLPDPTSAGTKIAPDLLFRCSDEDIGAFLAGYFDGDGTVGVDAGPSAVTKSERLARDVVALLARLGVVAFLRPIRARATNGSGAWARYWIVNVSADDIFPFAERVPLRCRRKAERLKALCARRLAGKRPSNWDTIPVDPALFRSIRTGLGLTQQATGRPSSVNNIENGYAEPTRPVVQALVERFTEADADGHFRDDLAYVRFLADEHHAWDHVVAVECVAEPPRYLYDLTVPETSSFIGDGVFLHNTHCFTELTGAMKNAFGGLLHEKRHWTHAHIHETLVDLLAIQKEIHAGVFAVMDATWAGDGPGPRCLVPYEKDLILASADQVAIDATLAKLFGWDPLSVKFIRLAHEAGLGVGDPREIEYVGDDIAGESWSFHRGELTFASRGQHMIYWGPLKPLEKFLLRTALAPWSYAASILYHDVYWYNAVGRGRVAKALDGKWGKLFLQYRDGGGLPLGEPHAHPAPGG